MYLDLDWGIPYVFKGQNELDIVAEKVGILSIPKIINRKALFEEITTGILQKATTCLLGNSVFAVSKCWTGAHPTQNPQTPTIQQLDVLSSKRACCVPMCLQAQLCQALLDIFCPTCLSNERIPF